MPDEQDLLRLVSSLEETLSKSANLGDDSRPEMVELRRKIAEIVAKISTIGDALFAIEPLRTEFKAELAKMRSATALHHASWPIVAIERSNPQYQASIRSAREANRRFIAWVRLQCDDIRTGKGRKI